ncbi:hypothetical protein [Kitasatospora sp. NPDC093806]|uniref:hypothetical protein n=1 Tax=Kitasatospora sp. NPDC093806 TaxID=3155075 RepID=UPI00343157D6
MNRVLRRLATLAAATALLAPAAYATDASAAPKAADTTAASANRAPGVYISPWGSAHVGLSDETKQWLRAENITLEAIAPFVLDADGNGFDMPIGSTAGDHLDSQGRIFYPGGIVLHHPASGHTFRLEPTWIRVMPTPLYSAGLSVDDARVRDEFPVADTTYADVIANGRPTLTGFKLEKVPFRVTQDTSDLIGRYTGRPGPRVGSEFGTLTPRFDYVPAG